MDSSFEQLKSMVVFAAIVDQGSFSAASRMLSISRASVSYHIKKLEQQLGLKLLYRSTRSISLTDAGSRYYLRCRAVVDQTNLAQQDIESFKNEPQGNLRITSPVGVGSEVITPMVSTFKSLYPKINVEILLTDSIVNLVADGFDIGIRGAANALKDSELQSIKLTPQTMCVCASPSYLKTYGRPMSPKELDNHNWIIYTSSNQTFSMTQGQQKYDVKMKGSMVTNHAQTRTQFVLDGHGLGKLAMYDAYKYLETGQLERILSEYEMTKVDLYAVFPAGAAQQRKLRLFIDHIKQCFSKLQKL
ncbi:LysR family transcriptional regulator [Pleionea sediminis]|uniref:LysR family transcriptional regulator n=1 Tax=Pleionea sediminis TaxID=2569479 RepID=UPI0011861026|nr:LysR family transcriptional regulator [Pleionea sediminis]